MEGLSDAGQRPQTVDTVFSSETPPVADRATTGPRPKTLEQRTAVQMAIIGGLLVFLALFAIAMRYRAAGPVSEGEAPTFTLQTFDGGQVSLAEHRGHVVVVNFWASWCPPCRDEAPYLEKVWRRYKDRGVVFIGVDYMDTEREARAYIREFDITYPNGPDLGSKISQAYRIRGVPETFFVDKQGKVAEMFIGPLDEPHLVNSIETLLRR